MVNTCRIVNRKKSLKYMSEEQIIAFKERFTYFKTKYSKPVTFQLTPRLSEWDSLVPLSSSNFHEIT